MKLYSSTTSPTQQRPEQREQDEPALHPSRNEFNLVLPDLRDSAEWDHRLGTANSPSSLPNKVPNKVPQNKNPAKSSTAGGVNRKADLSSLGTSSVFASASTTQERVTQASMVSAGTTIVSHLPALLKARSRAQREQAFNGMLAAASTNGSVIEVSSVVFELLKRMKGAVLDLLAMPGSVVARLGGFVSHLSTLTVSR
jgi:hypothetical protein